MQNLQRDSADLQPIACLDDAQGDAAFMQDAKYVPHASRRLVRERRRVRHLADGEAVEQIDDAVEMIEIGVREKNFIDAADAVLPEERSDLPACHLGSSERAGVVQERASIRGFNHRATAVSDGEKRAVQLIARHARGAGGETDAQPTESGDAGPTPATA